MNSTSSHRRDSRSPQMDAVIEKLFIVETPEQASLRDQMKEAGFPQISLSPMEGQWLYLLLKMVGAKRGIEVGTLGGYSASWILRALEGQADSMFWSLEKDSERARWAREQLQLMKFSTPFEILEGAALEVLEKDLANESFDFVFIDANKSQTGDYARWAMERVRSGGLVLIDNAFIWGGMAHLNQEIDWKNPDLQFNRTEFRGMSEAWLALAQSVDFECQLLQTSEGMLVARRK